MRPTVYQVHASRKNQAGHQVLQLEWVQLNPLTRIFKQMAEAKPVPSAMASPKSLQLRPTGQERGTNAISTRNYHRKRLPNRKAQDRHEEQSSRCNDLWKSRGGSTWTAKEKEELLQTFIMQEQSFQKQPRQSATTYYFKMYNIGHL